MRELEVPLAPSGEQRRIADRIDFLRNSVRDAREALEAIPPLIEKFRQSILAAAFRGDLTADWRAKNPYTESAPALLDRIRKQRRKKWEATELAKMKARGITPTQTYLKFESQRPGAGSGSGPGKTCGCPLRDVGTGWRD
jgi:type I restriction enzyme S subunit